MDASNLFSAGFLLLLLGGVMQGAFPLPLKFTTRWRWEHIWGAGSLMALLLIPWPVALATVPDLWDVYAGSPTSALVGALLFGAAWGIGGVFYGLGVAAVGLSLGLSLILGLIAVFGSLIPLALEHPERITHPSGLTVLGGVAIMIVGLSVCGLAGRAKQDASAGRASGVPFAVGLTYCVLAGVLSAFVNFGLIYGASISSQAVARGTTPGDAPNAVWALVFSANYLVNAGYCVWLIARRSSWSTFRARGTGRYWMAAAVMGALWAGGIVVYGRGAVALGELGAFIGFPVMLTASILTGNVLGVLSGEWRDASSKARRLMVAGVGLLILAVVVLAYANRLV
ncbi:MAG: hypothetical protein KJ061_09305 [Vicinamibacteraceae bacterium]|nr:hypothetical protein [Vicinamibacteraceae bacterium]